jgi:hypothetical protein
MTTVYLTRITSDDRIYDTYISRRLDSAIDWAINGILSGSFNGLKHYSIDKICNYFSVKNEAEFIESVKSVLTNHKYFFNEIVTVHITEEILHD